MASVQIAGVFAYRKELDRAFMWLDNALEYNDPGLMNLNHESFLENLHGDSRRLELQKRIGVAPEQIDAIELVIELP